ncbi:gluconate 2-dehydrogenase subunit 3 family protein [Jiulongibacter sp. NS-SX5]|uniref:gluconate 2-dehydrogenase subunit 3 family protein n=1 Tax=Jiulongibacter sp. NS-SX5 TaxID=3463854 RepID=UPI004059CEF4
MNRRDALNRVAVLMGGALSAPTMVALLEGCTTKDASAPFSLSADYQEIVAQFADIIIPATDTPGAKEVGVGPFIEMMIKDCYSDAQGEHFKKGLSLVEEKSKELGSSFTSLTNEQQIEVVKAMETEAANEAQKAKEEQIDPETGKVKEGSAAEEPVTPFFTLIKELTLFGYFTSEVGMTQELDYVPIPGRFEGCIPLKEGQKAYALG